MVVPVLVKRGGFTPLSSRNAFLLHRSKLNPPIQLHPAEAVVVQQQYQACVSTASTRAFLAGRSGCRPYSQILPDPGSRTLVPLARAASEQLTNSTDQPYTVFEYQCGRVKRTVNRALIVLTAAEVGLGNPRPRPCLFQLLSRKGRAEP